VVVPGATACTRPPETMKVGLDRLKYGSNEFARHLQKKYQKMIKFAA